ncbi:MAG: hypothetical protein RR309_04865 [Cellulosilyticaceae bacterium]
MKSTLLTIVATGIAFLGGLIIGCKKPFIKKEQAKKDYIEVPKAEEFKEQEVKKQEVKKQAEIIFKENQITEQDKLLEMLRVVIVDSKRDKWVLNKKEAVRVGRDKRLALDYKGHHMVATHSQKQLHKIREPSVAERIQIESIEKSEEDQGG